MPTPSLPTELWHEIVAGDWVGWGRDTHSLILVNKQFHEIFLPVVYSRIEIVGPTRSIDPEKAQISQDDSRYALAGQRAAALLDNLEANEALRGAVRTCNIKQFFSRPRIPIPLVGWERASKLSFEYLMGSIFTLIGKLPSLKTLHVSGATLPITCLLHICSRPNQALAITDDTGSWYGAAEVEPDTIFTLSSLKSRSGLFSNNAAVQITLGGSLKQLFLASSDHSGLARFFEAHIGHGDITLPNLEVLELGWLSEAYLPFFKMTPNLRTLRLKTALKLHLGSIPLDETFMPHLRHFEGHNAYLPIFAHKRPITLINTRDSAGYTSGIFMGQDDGITLEPLGRFFGALDNVKTIVWGRCSRNRELMEYLVNYNPGVVHLTLTPSMPYTREEFHDRLQTLKGLKELQTLYIRCFQHVPNKVSLDWEREHCEMLQREGSSGLVSVSFSDLIDWERERGSSTWIPSGPGLKVYEMYLADPLPSSILPLVME